MRKLLTDEELETVAGALATTVLNCNPNRRSYFYGPSLYELWHRTPECRKLHLRHYRPVWDYCLTQFLPGYEYCKFESTWFNHTYSAEDE
ncbi:MAG: hypothetical protein U0223_16885 [Nitrospira sp.]|nr:hypothetical protein [Nitrospira sp.]